MTPELKRFIKAKIRAYHGRNRTCDPAGNVAMNVLADTVVRWRDSRNHIYRGKRDGLTVADLLYAMHHITKGMNRRDRKAFLHVAAHYGSSFFVERGHEPEAPAKPEGKHGTDKKGG